ncbi:hypothetical protein BpHYR1_042925 [Brachionus plicatilis]|uniref:Uncharacterized protein n=1 Tax=Brachionus plicatilis TaxID=10195 RepID=A0A3M7QDG8_BRAPC|nr:hypothetical protein BpHYR1_042925 [Brachionus plicatilis]
MKRTCPVFSGPKLSDVIISSGLPIDTRVAFKRIAFNGFADVALNASNAVNNDFIVNESRLYWLYSLPFMKIKRRKPESDKYEINEFEY